MLRNQFLKGLISLPFFGAAGVVKAVEPVGKKPLEPGDTAFYVDYGWDGDYTTDRWKRTFCLKKAVVTYRYDKTLVKNTPKPHRYGLRWGESSHQEMRPESIFGTREKAQKQLHKEEEKYKEGRRRIEEEEEEEARRAKSLAEQIADTQKSLSPTLGNNMNERIDGYKSTRLNGK